MTADDQVKAYIKKIMGQLKEWMYGGKISKLVVVITSKETGEHVERWQFDVCLTMDGAPSFLTMCRSKFTGRTRGQSHPRRAPIKKTPPQSTSVSYQKRDNN